MSDEAPIHMEAMNQSKSAFAGEIVVSSIKRTHQQLQNGSNLENKDLLIQTRSWKIRNNIQAKSLNIVILVWMIF